MAGSASPARRGLRHRRVAVVALALAGVGALGVAGASSLAVQGRGAFALHQPKPCTGSATVTPALQQNPNKFDGVQVNLPAGCSGLISVTVVAKGDFSASTTIASSGVIDFQDTYNVKQFETVMATVDGWDLPVTWTP